MISVKASEIKNTANSSFPVTLFSSQDTTETPTEDQTTCDLESNSLSIPQHDGDHNILRIDISDTGPGITKVFILSKKFLDLFRLRNNKNLFYVKLSNFMIPFQPI